MQVFVILVNWNGCHDTINCLDSLSQIQSHSLNIIVIDNNSSDDSVYKIKTAFPELLVKKLSQNIGFAGGNNIGITHALNNGADFIWILNNDTKVYASTLSEMMNTFVEDERIGAVGSVLYLMDNPGQVQAWGGGFINMWRGIARHCYSESESHLIAYLTGASLLVKREVFDTIGLLDESFFMYWEDVDFCFRLKKAGWNLAVATKSIILHKESASTGHRSPLFYFMFNESLVRFFMKHSRHPTMPILFGVSEQILKRLLKFEIMNIPAILRGLLAGLHQYFTKTPPIPLRKISNE